MTTDGGLSHQEQVRIMLRPIGSGLPLGFFAFGIGMLLLGSQSIAWIPLHEQKDVGMTLVSFVFPLELIATVVAFLARDTLAATTLGLFSASWLTIGVGDISSPPGTKTTTLAIDLIGFSAAVLLLALMSTLGKPFFSVLLLGSVVRMVLSAAYELGAATSWNHVAGGFGLGLAAVALYGGTALGLEDARRREVLPLFRRGGAMQAFEGYEAQLERLESEPGVRQQL